MSRRSTTRSSTVISSRSTSKQSTQNDLLARLPEQEQHLLALDDDQLSNASDTLNHLHHQPQPLPSLFERTQQSSIHQSLFSRITSTLSKRITSSVNGVVMNGGPPSIASSDSMLTRSQCVPGKCSATGCALHKERRKRKPRNLDDASTNTDSVAGDFDQPGLDAMSDDEHAVNDFTPTNFTSKTASTPKTGSARTNGTRHVPVPNSAASTRVRRNVLQGSARSAHPNDDVEELTIVRNLTRITNLSSSDTFSVRQRLMEMAPEPVQRITRQVTSVVPLPVILTFFLLTIAISLWYFSLVPTVDGCYRSWTSFMGNVMVIYSFICDAVVNSFGYGASICSGTFMFLKSLTVTSWSFLISKLPSFSSSSNPSFVYSSMDPIDAQTLAKIQETLKVYGQTLESLDSRLTGLNREVNANKIDIEHLKKTCCKDPKELEAIINNGVRSFWIKMFPSLSPSANDEVLKKQVQEHLSKIAEETASGVHGHQIGEFNDRFQRKLEDVTQQLLVQIHELQTKEAKSSGQDKTAKIDIDDTITRSAIQRMITDAISMYDADKTGIPDFALEPSGGSVINTRCSETYSPQNRQYMIFGIPVWTTSTSPRAVIQPSIAPGECWAFKGHEGHLVIKLSREIIPTSFAYEHIPRSISRDGNIDSAPRLFQVRGLNDEFDKEGDVLGNYEYLDHDTPLQTFDVQERNPKSYRFVELIIKSNYGNQEYTCLYRFRVHGQRV